MTGKAGAEAAVRAAALPLRGAASDYDALLDLVGGAKFVLLGEASHGTHEFYRERAAITRRLIEEKGFNAVAVEADWPDAYRVNRFVRGIGDDAEAVDSLGDFKRFPTWMWRNADVLDFVGWLRGKNDRLDGGQERKTGFYGVDLYSLFTSIARVIEYLEAIDHQAAQRARSRYACFEHFGEDSQAYGYAATFGLRQSCEDEVVAQLVDFRRRAAEYASRDGRIPPDEAFFAEQNIRLIANAERYYRSMFAGRASSWNLRDTHMADTIDALAAHLRQQGREPRIVVWEHNSHLGDARATEMGRDGELNVGQLMRERHGEEVRLIGFTTWSGTVTAASEWDGPAEHKRVRPALEGSYEDLFHRTGLPSFWLPLHHPRVMDALAADRLERAIGVIYMPQSERASHYFDAALPFQFDAVLHFDETRAVEPLERWPRGHSREMPETYPSAI